MMGDMAGKLITLWITRKPNGCSAGSAGVQGEA